jgi:N-carbamoylputrescine amidase
MPADASRSRIVVGLVQMSMGDDLAANTSRAVELIRNAAEQGAQVVCLPELFRSRYFCQTEDASRFDLAEPVPGPTTDVLAKLAVELGCVIVASLFERRAAGIYHNTAAVLDAETGYLDKYRKMHIPDDPKYFEKFYFTPGDLGFRSFPTAFANIGVLICWDQWYPEAARLTALRGAELLLYPTAIGWHPEERATYGDAQRDAWETVQRSHAIANGCFVAAVNRVGFEPTPGESSGIEFWGSSFVTAPDGTVLARAPDDAEAVLVAELDLGRIAQSRIGWPFLRDRRIDAYDDIKRRYVDAAAASDRS